MKRKLWIQADATRCRDCQVCVLACSLYHEGESNPALSRIQIQKDMARYEFSIVICRHCAEPECAASCPTQALQIDERGVVVLEQEDCIQCGCCADACPYSALFFDERMDKYFKCTLCGDREAGPLCVELCPAGALSLVNGRD